MISLFLCDDEPVWLDRLSALAEEAAFGLALEITQLKTYTRPQQLLDHLREHPCSCCVYLLDVDLKSQISGLELASQIRFANPRCFILFVTTHEEMAFKTFEYKVEALDYIIKDSGSLKEQIYRCLKHIQDLMLSTGAASNALRIRSGGSYILIPLEELLFLETIKASHKLLIHSSRECAEVSASLMEMQEKLNDSFFQCHKAYIVNLKRIKEIRRTEKLLVMDNGELCPCSFRLFAETCRRFLALQK